MLVEGAIFFSLGNMESLCYILFNGENKYECQGIHEENKKENIIQNSF